MFSQQSSSSLSSEEQELSQTPRPSPRRKDPARKRLQSFNSNASPSSSAAQSSKLPASSPLTELTQSTQEKPQRGLKRMQAGVTTCWSSRELPKHAAALFDDAVAEEQHDAALHYLKSLQTPIWQPCTRHITYLLDLSLRGLEEGRAEIKSGMPVTSANLKLDAAVVQSDESVLEATALLRQIAIRYGSSSVLKAFPARTGMHEETEEERLAFATPKNLRGANNIWSVVKAAGPRCKMAEEHDSKRLKTDRHADARDLKMEAVWRNARLMLDLWRLERSEALSASSSSARDDDRAASASHLSRQFPLQKAPSRSGRLRLDLDEGCEEVGDALDFVMNGLADEPLGDCQIGKVGTSEEARLETAVGMLDELFHLAHHRVLSKSALVRGIAQRLEMVSIRGIRSIHEYLVRSEESAVPLALAFAQHLHSESYERGENWPSASARQSQRAQSSMIDDLVSRLPDSHDGLLYIDPGEPLLDLHLTSGIIDEVENAKGKLRKELRALEDRWTEDVDEEDEEDKQSRPLRRTTKKPEDIFWSSGEEGRRAIVITLWMRLAELQAYLRNGHIFAFILTVLSSHINPSMNDAKRKRLAALCRTLVETLNAGAKSTSRRAKAIQQDMDHFQASRKPRQGSHSSPETMEMEKIVYRIKEVSAALNSLAFAGRTMNELRQATPDER
ncbi:hypothetical protein CBOM_00630 [Ceraceosorus bombacis]|uniref:Uncharacterized protein n=1 Tax=Ceraceosorus bombacis TaxID=401625 RepID=A0A0P1B9W8_9BASI|nr:hypothetical protein CBOM_00630 [Ceraceosorus bombacis]